MKKILIIALSLVTLAACKGGMKEGAGSWLDGDKSSETGDQTNAVNVVFFGYDSSSLDAAAKAKLVQQAQMWKDSAEKPTLVLEGHCDERGTVEYNIGLGNKRAHAVKKDLEKLGVPADKMEIISYGKERPAVEGHDEHAWKLNRRVVTIGEKK